MASPKDMPAKKESNSKRRREQRQKPRGKADHAPPPGKDDFKAKEFEEGYRQGMAEGKRTIRTMVLTFLEKEYMAPSVERGGPYGKDILELTRKLSALLKK